LRAIHHGFVRRLGAADTGAPSGARFDHAKFVVVNGRAAAALSRSCPGLPSSGLRVALTGVVANR
jgi:hypothetical protein